MKGKKLAVVDQDRCVSCGECAHTCKIAAIAVINGCHAWADPKICVGCGMCAKACPVGCIEIITREDNQDEQ